MADKKSKVPKVFVGVRLPADDVAELDRMGAEGKPVPANRSEMIQVAVKEYVERNGKKKPK
jgi:metal-responsive CopG/Arc/MetJ family transcriptional regulator